MPLLGHDFAIWFDQLMIGKWHFAHQGLLPLRFSPHACGGAPVYGDPESIFYSLAQTLSFVIHPYLAIQISIVVALIGGFFGWIQFGKKALGLDQGWSHLLSLIMIANGFVFIHLAVGHFQMHTMPLMGWLLFLLFDQTPYSRKVLFTRTCIFALLTIYILCGAGYNVLLFSALTGFFFLLFDLVFSNDSKGRIRELLLRFALFGGTSLLILSSKLVAVLSFMRFFPRVEGYAHMWDGTNLFEYIIRSFWEVFPTRESIPGYGWDLHEKSIFLSPVVWMGLLAGLYFAFKNRAALFKERKKTVLILLLSLFTFLFLTQLAQGHGFLVDQFLTLPVIRSLRVASRFLYIFSIFISILSIFSLSKVCAHLNQNSKVMVLNAASILTLLSLTTGWYAVHSQLLLAENYDLRTKQFDSLEKIHYEQLSVTDVKNGNTDYVRAGNICHIELLKKTYPLPLLVGPTSLHYQGAYNLMNPACYQYPEENHCKPGDRIRTDDEENFQNFSRGMPVTWKLSLLQHIADYTSLLTLIFCVCYLIRPKR